MYLADGCVRVPRQSQSNARHFKSSWPQVCRPVHRATFRCRVRHSMHAHRPIAYRHDPCDERRRLHVLAQAYLYISGALQVITCFVWPVGASQRARVQACCGSMVAAASRVACRRRVAAPDCCREWSRHVCWPAGGVWGARERGPCCVVTARDSCLWAYFMFSLIVPLQLNNLRRDFL